MVASFKKNVFAQRLRERVKDWGMEDRNTIESGKPDRQCDKNFPCPVCGSIKSWCGAYFHKTKMVVICHRISEGGEIRRDKTIDRREYYIHRLPLPEVLPTFQATTPEPAEPDTLHEVYEALLGVCELPQDERAKLKAKGLTDEIIDQEQFGYLPSASEGRDRIAKVMFETFGDKLDLVPGFVPKENGTQIMGQSGRLLPCRDEDGKIHALEIRTPSHDPDKRYQYFTSATAHGPKAPHIASTPIQSQTPQDTERLTEGKIKALRAVMHDGIPTHSIPGVNSWRKGLDRIVKRGATTLLLALDMDHKTKPTVCRALCDCATAAMKAGLTVVIETWDEKYKGIDDAINAEAELSRTDAKEYLKTLPTMNDWPAIEDVATSLEAPLIAPNELIEGMCYENSKISLSGGSKEKKTFTMAQCSVCVATGIPFLGRKTRQGRVLYINLELRPYTFLKRIKDMEKALGVTIPKGCIDVWHLRGIGITIEDLAQEIRRRIGDKQYALIVIDPLYKILGERSENDSSQMANLLGHLEEIAHNANASYIICHHYPKGSAVDKKAIHRGAGSGVLGRDGDCVWTMTEHQTPDCVTFNTSLRDFAQVPEFVIRWKYPIYSVDASEDPQSLKGSKTNKRGISVEDILTYLTVEPQTREQIIQRVKEKTGCGENAIRIALAVALRKPEVLSVPEIRPGKRHNWLYSIR